MACVVAEVGLTTLIGICFQLTDEIKVLNQKAEQAKHQVDNLQAEVIDRSRQTSEDKAELIRLQRGLEEKSARLQLIEEKGIQSENELLSLRADLAARSSGSNKDKEEMAKLAAALQQAQVEIDSMSEILQEREARELEVPKYAIAMLLLRHPNILLNGSWNKNAVS